MLSALFLDNNSITIELNKRDVYGKKNVSI